MAERKGTRGSREKRDSAVTLTRAEVEARRKAEPTREQIYAKYDARIVSLGELEPAPSEMPKPYADGISNLPETREVSDDEYNRRAEQFESEQHGRLLSEEEHKSHIKAALSLGPDAAARIRAGQKADRTNVLRGAIVTLWERRPHTKRLSAPAVAQQLHRLVTVDGEVGYFPSGIPDEWGMSTLTKEVRLALAQLRKKPQ